MCRHSKIFDEEGLCSFCGVNKTNIGMKTCLYGEKTQSASDADYLNYLNEIEEIRRLFFQSYWKKVPRKRVRSTRKLIDLDFVDFTDLIRSQQRKTSEEIVENGKLFL